MKAPISSELKGLIDFLSIHLTFILSFSQIPVVCANNLSLSVINLNDLPAKELAFFSSLSLFLWAGALVKLCRRNDSVSVFLKQPLRKEGGPLRKRLIAGWLCDLRRALEHILLRTKTLLDDLTEQPNNIERSCTDLYLL